jgi:hypothetical protein
MDLKNIITDWGGFEELIKDLHNVGDVSVERNVTIIGNSGSSRQIDVLLKHKKGPYEYSTLIECKYWNHKVERQHIDILHSSMTDLNASKGVFFTTLGYQKGAVTYAKSKGIVIFVIRELTDEEWGLPGRVVDLYLHIVKKTILRVECFNTKAAFQVGQEKQNDATINLDFNGTTQNNLIVSEQQKNHRTLESYLEFVADDVVSRLKERPFIINSGEECTRYFQIDVNMPLKENGKELQVLSSGVLIFIPTIFLSVGIKVSQSRLIIDRAKKYIYVLAIEDCINNQIFLASKKEQQVVNWLTTNPPSSRTPHPDAIKNGSIITVVLKDLFDPKEMDGLKEINLPLA